MEDNTQTQESLTQLLRQLKQSALKMLKIFFDLFTCELQLAGKSLIIIVGLTIILFILIASSWIAFLALIVYLLHFLGLSWVLSWLIAFCANIAMTIICFFTMRRFIRYLGFAATRQQFATLTKGEV